LLVKRTPSEKKTYTDFYVSILSFTGREKSSDENKRMVTIGE